MQYPFLTEEDVKIYHANSFADEPLPWLRKESINEGLKGTALGGTAAAVLALTVGSLSKTFHIHPKLFTGISTLVGAMVGHFLQKHYFIDFTNYVKLKRLVEYDPDSYEIILEMMQKNADKFYNKDPKKYKQIIQNLKRLEKNPPQKYRNYLDAEIEDEDDFDDSDLFDIRDKEGNLIKRGTSEVTGGYRGFSPSRLTISDGEEEIEYLISQMGG